jgi:hypothetical protein
MPLGESMKDNIDHEVGKTRPIYPAIRRVISAAAGKNRDEVRSMFTEELRSRGIELPSGETMDAYLTMIAKGIMEQSSGRPAPRVEWRPGRWSRIRSRTRIIRNARMMRDLLPQYSPGRRISFIDPDRTQPPIEVVLETSARDWLASGKLKLPRRVDPSGRIDIWLDSKTNPDGGTAVLVHLMDRLIGSLRPEDAELFRPAIEDASARKYVLMTSGYIGRDDDEEVRFYVYRPLLGFA